MADPVATTTNTAPAPAALPESATVDEAVRLMEGIADDPAPETKETDAGSAADADQPGDQEAASDAAAEADEGEAAAEEQEAEAAPDAPEFWTADEKAAWAKVPDDVKAVIKAKEEQRSRSVDEKMREAAAARQAATAEIDKYKQTFDQSATWWQQNGQKFVQTFVDRWAGVDWATLAKDNPAKWAELKEMQSQEHGLLQQAEARGRADREAAQARAKAAFEESRNAEHAKVAAELPEFFGTAAKSKATYDKIGAYLYSQGIPTERINIIHEAPIIKLALKAMRFDEAQKLSSAVTSSGTANNPAKAAPTRVAPGPARRTGNQASEEARQVSQRFRKSGGSDINDAAALIRLNGL